jgi:serine/threonine-protein kinase RsbW
MTHSNKLSVASELKNVKGASQEVLESLSSFDLPSNDMLDIRLCLEEAIINSMKYGNNLNPDLPVEIQYSVKEGMLKITISDQGKGFDYKNLPDPTLEENLQELKGRGVYLIKRLMDEVSFNESGNQITMIKRINKGE